MNGTINKLLLGLMAALVATTGATAAVSYPPGALTLSATIPQTNRVVLTWTDYKAAGYTVRDYVIERSHDGVSWSTLIASNKNPHYTVASYTNLDLNIPVGSETYRVSACVTNTMAGSTPPTNQYWLTNTFTLTVPAAKPDPMDPFKPSWRGVNPASYRSSYQDWQFSTSALTGAPENVSNAYGAPTATVTLGGLYAGGWSDLNYSQAGNVQGSWDLGVSGHGIDPSIVCTVPTWSPAGTRVVNYVLIQVSQLLVTPGNPQYGAYWGTTLPNQVGDPSVAATGLLGPNGLVGSWQTVGAVYRLDDGNPASETITIVPGDNSGLQVDEVIVDTISRPLPVDDTTTTTANTPASFPAARLLANDGPADGPPLDVAGVSATSTNGGTVTLANGVVTYTPPANYVGTDAFLYTNTLHGLTLANWDALPETAQVVVQIAPASSQYNMGGVSLPDPNGVRTITAWGIPGYTYRLQRTSLLQDTNTVWVDLPSTAIASPGATNFGLLNLLDTNPPSPSFYRTRSPATP